MSTNQSTALATATPSALAAPGLLFAAFAQFCANPTALALTGFNAAATPFIPAAPVANANDAPWRAVTDADAFTTGFTEIRVETSRTLRSDALEEIGRALGYAFAETVLTGELVLTGVEQKLALVAGHIDTNGGTSILTFGVNSASSRRTRPDFNRAFEVGRERIFNGSKIRTSDRQGAGTMGTKLVAGIGPGRCEVQFFVR